MSRKRSKSKSKHKSKVKSYKSKSSISRSTRKKNKKDVSEMTPSQRSRYHDKKSPMYGKIKNRNMTCWQKALAKFYKGKKYHIPEKNSKDYRRCKKLEELCRKGKKLKLK
jgi:hypothetical protein